VSDLVQEILRRQEMMERVRTLWEPAWKDVVTYLLPRRGDIYVDNKPQGVRRNTRIFDSTATDAAEILAAALHGMLTNPASPWFVLYTPNRALMQDRGVREWLEEATATILHSDVHCGGQVWPCGHGAPQVHLYGPANGPDLGLREGVS